MCVCVCRLAFDTSFKLLNFGSDSHGGEDSSVGNVTPFPKVGTCVLWATDLQSEDVLFYCAVHVKFCGSCDLLNFSPD